MITWRITNLSWRDDGQPGEISQIHWICEARDGERAASCYGSVMLPPADPDRFVPLADLDQDRVTAWLRARLRGTMGDIEAEAQRRLDALERPAPTLPAWIQSIGANEAPS